MTADTGIPDRIEVVAFRRRDLPAIVKWRNDPAVNRYLRPAYRTLPEVEDWYEHYFGAQGNRLFAVLTDGTLVGYCTIEAIERENNKCELGIVIGEERYRRRGIGTAAIRQLLRMAFAELGMHRVEAVIHGDNVASVTCFSRLGFRLDARLRDARCRDGTYVDLLVYSLLDSEWPEDRA
jgi:RimJ/RimL family protein N-acetyltransferase